MTPTLKKNEIARMTYKSSDYISNLLADAVKAGTAKRVKQGHYEDTPELREWIRKLANGEKV